MIAVIKTQVTFILRTFRSSFLVRENIATEKMALLIRSIGAFRKKKKDHPSHFYEEIAKVTKAVNLPYQLHPPFCLLDLRIFHYFLE